MFLFIYLFIAKLIKGIHMEVVKPLIS